MKYNLALYFFPQCPFCQLVLRKIDELKLKSIEMNNTMEDRKHAEKLINDTGRSTVPCLYINGKPMHESRDIVIWLESNKEDLS